MLNLLPPSEKKILAREKKKRLFMILCFEFFVFLVCIFLVLLAVEFYILGEVAWQNFLFGQVKAESQSDRFLYFENVMQNYNQKLVLIDSFYEKQKFAVPTLITLLSVERPEGLHFTKFSLQLQGQPGKTKVVITGFSDTRDNLIIFKNNIEAEKKIEGINFSADSWINPKDINFHLTLDIIDGN